MNYELRTKEKIFLFVILFLAAILRFWSLNNYPALNADEAAIGYNAYSLIQTGKDEHGNPWPIHFQSFNDYKPGLYFYLVLPFVKVFGLNEWAVRIPNATLGVLTVLVVYLLVKELFREEKLALVSSLLLAISPWHIHFSRGGWEANTATFLITLGVWLFVKSANNGFKWKYLTLSFLALVASLYTYHSARIVVPLLGIGFAIIYRRELLKNFKSVLVAGGITILVLLPLVRDFMGPAGISRASGVGLLADQGPLNRVNEQRGEHGTYENWAVKLLHNKPINYSLAFLQNWLGHYDGHFLFISGDEIQRNKVPEMGEMYLFDVVFIFIGFLTLIRNFRDNSKSVKVILVWLLFAPAAAALTFQSPHALRAENMVIPLEIISAFGLTSILKWMRNVISDKKYLFVISHLAFIILITLSFARYEHMYWVHMAKEYPFSSQYGIKELISFVTENESKFKQVVVTDRYDQPYILFLFYLKYPPALFQKEQVLTPRDQFGFSTVRSFDKYIFTSITSWDEARNQYKGALIAGTDAEIPGGNIINRIYFPNGQVAFKIVAN